MANAVTERIREMDERVRINNIRDESDDPGSCEGSVGTCRSLTEVCAAGGAPAAVALVGS
jgi:hypothetical protein